MLQVLDNAIVAAVADPDTYRVTVTWSNGESTINRFDCLVGRGILTAIADPAVFSQLHVGERGRSLAWPGEIDFCADALWFQTHPAETPQPPHQEADQASQLAIP